MVKLKLQSFGIFMWTMYSLEKTLMLGKIEGKRRIGWQRMRWLVGWHHWLNEHDFEQMQGDTEDVEAWHAAVRGVTKNQTWLSYWTTPPPPPRTRTTRCLWSRDKWFCKTVFYLVIMGVRPHVWAWKYMYVYFTKWYYNVYSIL